MSSRTNWQGMTRRFKRYLVPLTMPYRDACHVTDSMSDPGTEPFANERASLRASLSCNKITLYGFGLFLLNCLSSWHRVVIVGKSSYDSTVKRWLDALMY